MRLGRRRFSARKASRALGRVGTTPFNQLSATFSLTVILLDFLFLQNIPVACIHSLRVINRRNVPQLLHHLRQM